MNEKLMPTMAINGKPKRTKALLMKMKRLSEDEIRENAHYIPLLESKYGFVFRPASYSEVPFASKDFSDADIVKSVSRIESFLLNTFVIDMGTNVHKEMHDLRYIFTEDEYKWHQTHNKLGINTWGIFFLRLMRLNELLKRNDLLLSPMVEGSANNEIYNGFTFGQKVAFCNLIDANLYGILETLKNRKRLRFTGYFDKQITLAHLKVFCTKLKKHWLRPR
jgi:hypothetical protein